MNVVKSALGFAGARLGEQAAIRASSSLARVGGPKVQRAPAQQQEAPKERDIWAFSTEQLLRMKGGTLSLNERFPPPPAPILDVHQCPKGEVTFTVKNHLGQLCEVPYSWVKDNGLVTPPRVNGLNGHAAPGEPRR